MTISVEPNRPGHIGWSALDRQIMVGQASEQPSPVLDLVVPVYNEAHVLEASVRRLRRYLDEQFPLTARVTVVDNASTDETWLVAQRLARDVRGVDAIHLDDKGRGRALRAAWSRSDAEVVAYTDVDLSTDLAALAPMVAALASGHSDVAIGSRLRRGARVARGTRREFISRSYNLILRATLAARFSDAQCGFKAVRTDVARRLLPLIEDEGWFFDTELLVLAQHGGLRILEVPVDWVDDPDSRVDLVATAVEDLKGVARMGRGLINGSLRRRLDDQMIDRERGFGAQLGRFAGIGALSTIAYVILFALLRGGLSAGWANFVALLVTAVANTALNRRVTFGVRGRGKPGRDHAVGLAAFGVGLAVTTGLLGLLEAVDPHAGRLVEIAVLLAGSALATLFRFIALRAVLIHADANVS
jgi:glycosyltransferase involved in cell wall biosynthesis